MTLNGFCFVFMLLSYDIVFVLQLEPFNYFFFDDVTT